MCSLCHVPYAQCSCHAAAAPTHYSHYTQVSAQAAQYVSLPLPSGDAALPAEHGRGRLDRHRHRRLPPLHKPRARYTTTCVCVVCTYVQSCMYIVHTRSCGVLLVTSLCVCVVVCLVGSVSLCVGKQADEQGVSRFYVSEPSVL